MKGALLNFIDSDRCIDPYLSDWEDVFSHIEACCQRMWIHPGQVEPIYEEQVAAVVSWLRAVDHCSPTGQIHATQVTISDLLSAEV